MRATTTAINFSWKALCGGCRSARRRYLEHERGITIENVIGPIGRADFAHLAPTGQKRAPKRLAREEQWVKGLRECQRGVIANRPIGSDIVGNPAAQKRLGEARTALYPMLRRQISV